MSWFAHSSGSEHHESSSVLPPSPTPTHPLTPQPPEVKPLSPMQAPGLPCDRLRCGHTLETKGLGRSERAAWQCPGSFQRLSCAGSAWAGPQPNNAPSSQGGAGRRMAASCPASKCTHKLQAARPTAAPLQWALVGSQAQNRLRPAAGARHGGRSVALASLPSRLPGHSLGLSTTAEDGHTSHPRGCRVVRWRQHGRQLPCGSLHRSQGTSHGGTGDACVRQQQSQQCIASSSMPAGCGACGLAGRAGTWPSTRLRGDG